MDTSKMMKKEEEEENIQRWRKNKEENNDMNDAEVINLMRRIITTCLYHHLGTYSVRPISGSVHVGTTLRTFSTGFFAPGPTARDVNTLHRQVKGLSQQMFDRANTEYSNLKRLSVMDKYLAEFDSDLRGQIKGQHALRKNVCTLEDQVRELVKGDREENKKLKMMLGLLRGY
ncbi:hypothetical protein Tco_1474215 [Tanacetum coccineum]|uniref:Uncharacterized protein n=1 Tax=Tanacetum coccineum TaxID=301880 RepID=A0ABQ5B6Z4_9ASTR